MLQLSNVLTNINEVVRSSFPQITVSEMRLEYQRIQMGTAYCLLGGAGASTLIPQKAILLINSFKFRNVLSSCGYSVFLSQDSR